MVFQDVSSNAQGNLEAANTQTPSTSSKTKPCADPKAEEAKQADAAKLDYALSAEPTMAAVELSIRCKSPPITMDDIEPNKAKLAQRNRYVKTIARERELAAEAKDSVLR